MGNKKHSFTLFRVGSSQFTLFCVEDSQKFKNNRPPPDEVFHFALLVKLNTFLPSCTSTHTHQKKGGGAINFRNPP